MKSIIGIDPSLTGSAVAVFNDDRFSGVHRFTSKPATGLHSRIRRFIDLAERITAIVRDEMPEVVLIEGYSFGSKGNISSICEFGGILREHIAVEIGEVVTFLEVPPSTLKKFVLGKGVGEKDLILQQVLKRWGYEAPDNDAADAYSLGRMALVIAGVCGPENEAQRQAVDVVVNGKAKPAKKRKAAAS